MIFSYINKYFALKIIEFYRFLTLMTADFDILFGSRFKSQFWLLPVSVK